CHFAISPGVRKSFDAPAFPLSNGPQNRVWEPFSDARPGMGTMRSVATGTIALAIAVVCALATCGAVWADPYPSRPVKIIGPTPPGGPVEGVGRVLAHALPPTLGGAVVVDNRAGAGNTIGSKEAALAEPDGYTLLFSSASGLVIAPMLHAQAG